jgi:hypothetical protein
MTTEPDRPPLPDEPVAPPGQGEPTGDGDEPVALSPTRLPPYVLTGGRARPVDESLAIEAQVITTRVGRGDLARLQFERREILALCREPHAVIEVAARLGLHLGVARVLVGDLVATGHLVVRRPDLDPARRMEIIERVIRGLDSIE